MKILVIGSGGREHALVWKLAQSKHVGKIFCAPGNGGISDIAECINIKADDIEGLLDFAKREKIDLTVVGPEIPLSMGIVDEFRKYGLKAFGPGKKAAQLEASKIFAKEFMARHKIPTADFKIFDSSQEAIKYIEARGAACVIKADGLAQGKGVVVAKDTEEARQAVLSMMEDRVFGVAGERIIIEECLEGEEASILVITDGKEVIPLASSQDHKRVFDADKGPNTGGMGAYSPAPVVSDSLFKEILDSVIYRAILGLNKEGIEYKGVLYAGIMITASGPKVLEFNVRFGDPETQAILPRIKSDLAEVMLAVAGPGISRLGIDNLEWRDSPCICVVLASGGYPGDYEKGKEISGLGEAGRLKDVVVFHAGTKKASGKYYTNGGRVLGVTALGRTIKDAGDRAYSAAEKIKFDGMHYRKDIGSRAMKP